MAHFLFLISLFLKFAWSYVFIYQLITQFYSVSFMMKVGLTSCNLDHIQQILYRLVCMKDLSLISIKLFIKKITEILYLLFFLILMFKKANTNSLYPGLHSQTNELVAYSSFICERNR